LNWRFTKVASREYRYENVQGRTKHDAEEAADTRILELQTLALRRARRLSLSTKVDAVEQI
jgi:hypothetical protein